MIVVELMFFDSDDYNVNTEVIPCESKEIAKQVAKKTLDKIVNEEYTFKNDEERKLWEKENVHHKNNGNTIFIKGVDCGYAWIKIIDQEPITADSFSSFNPEIKCFY